MVAKAKTKKKAKKKIYKTPKAEAKAAKLKAEAEVAAAPKAPKKIRFVATTSARQYRAAEKKRKAGKFRTMADYIRHLVKEDTGTSPGDMRRGALRASKKELARRGRVGSKSRWN